MNWQHNLLNWRCTRHTNIRIYCSENDERVLNQKTKWFYLCEQTHTLFPNSF